MSWDHEDYRFGIRFHLGFCFWYFSIVQAEILHSNILLKISNNILANLTFSFSATQIKHGQEMMLVLSNQRPFTENFPSRIDVLFLSSQFDTVHIHR